MRANNIIYRFVPIPSKFWPPAYTPTIIEGDADWNFNKEAMATIVAFYSYFIDTVTHPSPLYPFPPSLPPIKA